MPPDDADLRTSARHQTATDVQPLCVDHLVKHYRLPGGGRLEAVRDISFSIAAGECFGLLGPNGAGKSTSIHCISGLCPASEGRITVCGYDVHHDPKRARAKLGICAQDETLDSDFRVLDQLVRYATFFRIPVEEGRRRAQALL